MAPDIKEKQKVKQVSYLLISFIEQSD